MRKLILPIVAATSLVLVTSQAIASETSTESRNVPKREKLVKKMMGGIRPLTVHGDTYLAGQPQQQDIALLEREGIKTVINLRKPEELRWDEKALVTRQGMQYVELPFQKPGELTPELFGRVRKILNDEKRGPVLLHCGSANRVGAIWYAHRILDDKLDAEAALREATQVGLRSMPLIAKAKSYVAQEQANAKTAPPSDSPADVSADVPDGAPADEAGEVGR